MHRFYLFTIEALIMILASCSSMGLNIDLTPVQEVPKDTISLQEAGRFWLDSLCSPAMMGRKTGTKGNHLAYTFINDELKALGYQPAIDSTNTENGSVIRNVIVTIQGAVDSTIIIGAHYDGAFESYCDVHYCAAEDNGSGVVTLLMLLKRLADEKPVLSRTIKCCFWDSEEAFEGRTYRGSTHYAQGISQEDRLKTLFYFNLDTIGHNHDETNSIFFEYKGGGGRMIEAVNTIASNERLVYVVTEKTKYGSDYVSFYEVGIPFMCYHDHRGGYPCEHPNHTTLDTPDMISIDRLALISSNVIDVINIY